MQGTDLKTSKRAFMPIRGVCYGTCSLHFNTNVHCQSHDATIRSNSPGNQYFSYKGQLSAPIWL